MRTAFIEQLIIEARKNKNIFLVVGDLGFSVVEPFIKEFPDRFLNAGIAEQNMTGIACGLAMEGYNVFTYSIGNFPTMRAFEQIRYDVCYHNLNVKIVSVGGGYAYGPLGVSHHATEDIGTLRVLPNMVVCAPGDPVEARIITTDFCNYTGPGFLRLGKAGEPIVHQNILDPGIGKAICVRKGKDHAILTTGAVLKYTFDYIMNSGQDIALYSFPYIKPIDNNAILDIAKDYANITTIEEHQRSGGFGSAVLEALHDLKENGVLTSIPNIKRIAIPDKFIGFAGTQVFLREQAGIKLI